MQQKETVVDNYLFDVYAEVTSFSVVHAEKRSYTVYQVDVKVNNRVFYLNRRYLDFETLNKKLRKKSMHVPDLPSRHLISKSPKHLEIRRQGLSVYLTRLIESFKGCLPLELVTFLELIEASGKSNYGDEFEDEQNKLQVNYPLISVQDTDIKALSNSFTVNDIIINGIISELYS